MLILKTLALATMAAALAGCTVSTVEYQGTAAQAYIDGQNSVQARGYIMPYEPIFPPPRVYAAPYAVTPYGQIIQPAQAYPAPAVIVDCSTRAERKSPECK
jgi:hypothetical protein